MSDRFKLMEEDLEAVEMKLEEMTAKFDEKEKNLEDAERLERERVVVVISEKRKGNFWLMATMKTLTGFRTDRV